ncbi:MAG: ZIP family metal transporter [Bdellovibrionota bacterium]
MTPILAALAHFLVVFIVGLFPLTWKLKGDIYDLFLSFGAGVLLSAAFLHMLPEATLEIGPSVGVFMMAGYVLMTILERFTMAHPCMEDDHCHNPDHRLGLVAFFGLSVHSVIAGMALGVGLMGASDISVSIALLAAILVHKVPETLALMALLAASHWSKTKMSITLVCFSCMGPGGILIGAFMNFQSAKFMGAALAISAGTFLWLASGDLLPHLHTKMKQKWINFAAFLVGLLALSFEAWHHLMG